MPGTQEEANVAVLIPAAGRGARLGGTRKQYRMLGGTPVLFQTIHVFEAHPQVKHLVLAVPEHDRDEVAEEAASRGVTKLAAVVPGGGSRQASVARALAAIPDEDDIVLVHDAVRPFVSPSLIHSVIAAVNTHGAAAPGLPVADTLRRATEGWFEETVPRQDLYRMQTPQGFRRKWLEAAHHSAEDFTATDDVELVQRAGYRVHLVEGRRRNIKITTREDWELAQLFWAEHHSTDH